MSGRLGGERWRMVHRDGLLRWRWAVALGEGLHWTKRTVRRGTCRTKRGAERAIAKAVAEVIA